MTRNALCLRIENPAPNAGRLVKSVDDVVSEYYVPPGDNDVCAIQRSRASGVGTGPPFHGAAAPIYGNELVVRRAVINTGCIRCRLPADGATGYPEYPLITVRLGSKL